MNKITTLILLTALAICLFTGCSEKKEITCPESYIEQHDGHKLSVFYTHHFWNVENSENFLIKITHLHKNAILELNTKYEIEGDLMKVTITIPENETIIDGEYILTSMNFISGIHRFIVEFKNEQVTFIDPTDVSYGSYLEGEGTEMEPYEINNSEDFNNFLMALSTDKTFGLELYFKQFDNFIWSSTNQDEIRNLGATTFGGNYDGGKFKIEGLTYNGDGNDLDQVDFLSNSCTAANTDMLTDHDDFRGIFKTLSNGANIKNLHIHDISITGANNYVGALAGTVTGLVSIENIKIDGHITGNNNVGGMIGSAGKDANLSITNCSINIQTYADDRLGGTNAGGVIGSSEGAIININGLKTFNNNSQSSDTRLYADRFMVNGKYRIGGVIGYIGSNSTVSVCNSILYHSSAPSHSEINVITGISDIGGIVGLASDISSTLTISDNDIVMNIKAEENNCGGYFGSLDINNGSLVFKNNLSCGVISGTSNIGSAAGFVKLNNSANVQIETFGFKSHSVTSSNHECLGKSYVGGLFGKVEGNNPNENNITIKETAIESNISSQDNSLDFGRVGGIIGYAENVSIILTNSHVGTGTTYIIGNFKTGGLIGELKHSIFEADNKINISKNKPVIPKNSEFHPNFNGNVKPYDSNNPCKYIAGGIGSVIESSISNIHIKGTINPEINESDYYTGGVFGYVDFGTTDNDYYIRGCSFNGIVYGGNYTGGIIGEVCAKGKVYECINYGEIHGIEQTGGVIGKVNYNDDEPYTNYCVNLGAIKGTNNVGGVIGYLSGKNNDDSWCHIHNCANYGNVSADANTSGAGVGGILGKGASFLCNIQYCVNFGQISGNGSDIRVGGISGVVGDGSPGYTLNVSLRECCNYGTVSSNSGGAHLGGITGMLEDGQLLHPDNSIVENCYNCGEIPSETSNEPGGIVGLSRDHSLIRNCINVGKIIYGNGIMGTDTGNGEYENCYTLEEMDKGGDVWPAHVTRVNATDMASSTYWNDKGFDFDNIWKMGSSHPELRNCPFQYTKAPTE
ncbi:MAG: hypothetical protein J6U71_00730 [Bacteroidales bacterium]|nr:hypothetical protein [Bacteroidales bacterium]